MRQHKHKRIEVITKYFKDKPAKVRVLCEECNVKFPELGQLIQEREDLGWKLRGNQPAVVFWSDDITWAEYRTFYDREEIEHKLSQ